MDSIGILPLSVIISTDIFLWRLNRIIAGKAGITVSGITLDQLWQPFPIQVSQGVRPDQLTDLFHRVIVGDELITAWYICSKIAGIQKRR